MKSFLRRSTSHPDKGYRKRYPVPRCLTHRGGSWRWRKHIPRHLRDRAGGAHEVVRGLGPIPVRYARQLADTLNQLAARAFAYAEAHPMADLKALLNRITKEYAEEILEYYRSYRALEVGPPRLRDTVGCIGACGSGSRVLDRAL